MLNSQMSKILENLLKAYETNKSDPFLQYGIAIEYRNNEEHGKALEFFRSVHENFPKYVPNYYHYSQALEAQGQIDLAKQICREGIDVASQVGDAHAVSELERALSYMPS